MTQCAHPAAVGRKGGECAGVDGVLLLPLLLEVHVCSVGHLAMTWHDAASHCLAMFFVPVTASASWRHLHSTASYRLIVTILQMSGFFCNQSDSAECSAETFA